MQTRISSISPAEFLKTFNVMSQQFNKTQSKFNSYYNSSSTPSNLHPHSLSSSHNPFPSFKTQSTKLTHLKKFPIPIYYNQMQGINVQTKQKQIQQIIKNKFNKQDEEFKQKHNTFIRKTLDKIIDNNVRHMKILEKSKEFYKMRAKCQEGSMKRALSAKSYGEVRGKNRGAKGKGGKKGENEGNEADEDYPEINFKEVDRKRVKSAYIISFNPSQTNITKKQQQPLSNFKFTLGKSQAFSKPRSSSVPKPSSLPLSKQPPSKPPSQLFPTKSLQISSKSNPSTLNNNYTHRTIFTEAPSKKSQKQAEGGDMDVETLLHTEKYIKTRFNETYKTIQYDYGKSVKAKSDKFLREIVYHYAND